MKPTDLSMAASEANASSSSGIFIVAGHSMAEEMGVSCRLKPQYCAPFACPSNTESAPHDSKDAPTRRG
ncbi:hypothetical protein G6O67_000703 [Ophiocordyceps sinensis]|uniref:Uncharacterized protein n=1 Tax=Ophiocordyceps sinensis TaxID=72228 RepID=A0A8H4PZL7_9HYPO|nr:hypothetical protein G6O67_000703 [Ophiocordyceps sinensis]